MDVLLPPAETISHAIEKIRPLRGSVPLPERGHGWQAQPESWYRLVGQICSVGSSRAWEALQTPSARKSLSVASIRAQEDRAAAYVHTILSELKIRYCSMRSDSSAKANAIAASAHSPRIADAEGVVCLLDQLAADVGQPGDQGLFTPDQARVARRWLIQNVRFFGPKSAGDFLLGLGLADSLLALDVRLLNLLIDEWGFDPSWRDRVHRLNDYERLESSVIDLFCPALQIEPVELDRLLFYGYASLRSRT